MNVLSALSASRSLTIAWATSCGWEDRYCLVKDGAPASVLGYFRFNLSNTVLTDAPAHGSISMPVLSLINERSSLVLTCNCFFAISAWSMSTRTLSVSSPPSKVSGLFLNPICSRVPACLVQFAIAPIT